MSARNKYILLALAACAALIVLLAPNLILQSRATPDAPARAFFDGWAKRDAAQMLAQLDPDARVSKAEIETLFAASIREFVDFKYEIVSQANERAVVRVTGKVKYNLSGERGEIPVDSQIPVVRKNGRWYLEAVEGLK